MYDYESLIREIIQPYIMETYFAKQYEALSSLFTEDTNVKEGSYITVPIRTSVSSNTSEFDKSDVNPVSGSHATVDAKWKKKYYHGAAEVHGIDESEGRGSFGDIQIDAIQDAIALEVEQMWANIYDAIYAQLKSDISAAGGYSDAALNRTTYPTLASYEEASVTATTLAIMRTAAYTTRLNKLTTPVSDYLWMIQEVPYNTFLPLAAALHTWNITGVANQSVDAGYQPVGNWEGTPVITPQGMTTGDMFYLRRRDVKIQKHLDFFIEQDLSVGKYTRKFIPRVGINLRLENPGFNAKLTGKT